MGGSMSVHKKTAAAASAASTNKAPKQNKQTPPTPARSNFNGRTVTATSSSTVDVNHIPLTNAQRKGIEDRIAHLEEENRKDQEVVNACGQIMAAQKTQEQCQKDLSKTEKEEAALRKEKENIQADLKAKDQVIANCDNNIAALDNLADENNKKMAALRAKIAAAQAAKQQAVTV